MILSEKYEFVLMPEGCESLDSIYGKSKACLALMPIGINGHELMKKSKQTEAERLECKKRGAEA